MPRLPQLDQSQTDHVRKQLGRVPNLYAAMANGPAALAGYLAFREQLAHAHDHDPHADAVLGLARAVMRAGGRVGDDELAQARAAGVTDAELAEIVAHVALNVFSNYFNHLAQPDLDFPAAPALEEATA